MLQIIITKNLVYFLTSTGIAFSADVIYFKNVLYENNQVVIRFMYNKHNK